MGLLVASHRVVFGTHYVSAKWQLRPCLSALPRGLQVDDVRNKLESLRSFSKQFPSLLLDVPGGGNAHADPCKVVPNAELRDVVGHVGLRGLVVVVVDAAAASARYGARLGLQNVTDSAIAIGPGDFVGCGDLEIQREGEEGDLSIPFAFAHRSCSSSTAVYASMQGDGYVQKTVASALELVLPRSPPAFLVYGHHALVSAHRKVTLSRAENLFACGAAPDPERLSIENVGVYAMIDAEKGTKTCPFFSFLPIYHFSPTSEMSGPTCNLQPMNGSQLIRVFVKKPFAIPAGQTLFPVWA